MGRKAIAEYERQLKTAEFDRTCLVTSDANERRHFNHMVEKGVMVAPMRGMYARTGYWEGLSYDVQHLHMVKALAKKHPDWVFSHYTAALIHGMYVSFYDLAQIHRVAEHVSGHSSKQICCHVSDEVEIEEVDGLHVTSFEQTAFDCLCELDCKQALAIVDSCCRIRGLEPFDFRDILDARAPGDLGKIDAARFAFEYANPKSESGGESVARATMIKLGYEVPELQVEIPDYIDEGNTYRVDFLWKLPDGVMIAGEMDGHEKYVNKEMTGGKDVEEVLIEERNRESHINAHRIPVMRISYADMVNEARFKKILEAFGVPRAY